MECMESKQAEQELNRCYKALWKHINALRISKRKKDRLAKLVYNVEEAVIELESYCGD